MLNMYNTIKLQLNPYKALEYHLNRFILFLNTLVKPDSASLWIVIGKQSTLTDFLVRVIYFHWILYIFGEVILFGCIRRVSEHYTSVFKP